MGFKEQGRHTLRRLGAAIVGAVGLAAMIAVGSANAQQSPVASYTFAGLSWGMKAADAKTALAKAGFRVTAQVAGKRKEFAIDRLHAVYSVLDRGKRLVATGRVEGYPVTVELAFGKNDSLNHVFIMSSFWNRTIPGARALITQAEKTVAALEKQYGSAKKRIDDRWPDTAYWGNAKDGSTLTVHVRGINGFMFSPSYNTAMRIDYANPKFNGGQLAGVRVDLNATGWSDGPVAGPAYMPAASPIGTKTPWVNDQYRN
jgi:hypothetical protein